jgi:hypothetical protein
VNYRAFVSSTFLDLQGHRTRVIEHLRRAGFIVDPMEDWTADTDAPNVFCLDRLRGCQVCVLLVGFRRGFIPPEGGLSITQREYEHAIAQGVDVLPFLLDENTAGWPKQFDERDDSELTKWRQAIRIRHGVSTFNADPASLDLTLPSALTRWVDAKQESGALRAYCEAIRVSHGYVRLLGLPKKKEVDDIPIDRLFVQPILENNSEAGIHASLSLSNAITNNSRMIVLGDPGTGQGVRA